MKSTVATSPATKKLLAKTSIGKIRSLGTQSSSQKLKGEGGEGGEEAITWITGRNLIIPEDQVELSDKELNEELARVLTTVNPSLILHHVDWSFREKAFVPSPAPPHHIIMMDFVGTSLHKESPEAILQMESEMGDEGKRIVKNKIMEEEPGEGNGYEEKGHNMENS